MSETTTNTANVMWRYGRRPRNFYRNLETGMVREFWSKPHYGKWEKTALQHACKPIGRKAMASRPTTKEDADGNAG